MRHRQPRNPTDPVSVEIRHLAYKRKSITEHEYRAEELMKDILAIEAATRNSDPKHFAYSTVATALRLRMDNQLRTAEEMRATLPADPMAVTEDRMLAFA